MVDGRLFSQGSCGFPYDPLLANIENITDKSYHDTTALIRYAAFMLAALLASSVGVALATSVVLSRHEKGQLFACEG